MIQFCARYGFKMMEHSFESFQASSMCLPMVVAASAVPHFQNIWRTCVRMKFLYVRRLSDTTSQTQSHQLQAKCSTCRLTYAQPLSVPRLCVHQYAFSGSQPELLRDAYTSLGCRTFHVQVTVVSPGICLDG